MSSAVEAVHSSRPAEGRPAAAPRALVVGVLADMLEENWPSMDLVADMLEQLDAQVIRITVTELKESTFYASITVQQNGSEVEIDSRPSDAIALAVRAEAPIFAADDVIEESAIEFEGEDVNEEEIVSEFRQFLDHVTPDEFAEASEEED